jgi:hypothetical protein
MPSKYWTKERPCQQIEPPQEKVYSRDYYKYNRDKILLKYKLDKQNAIVDEVKKWKEDMLNNPNAFNPFREI